MIIYSRMIRFSTHFSSNIREIASAGADTFVAGSAIFNTEDYKDTIDKMRSELAQAKQ